MHTAFPQQPLDFPTTLRRRESPVNVYRSTYTGDGYTALTGTLHFLHIITFLERESDSRAELPAQGVTTLPLGGRLLMLGPPMLLYGSETVALRSRKGQALLWYLAAHPDTTFPREHLHGLLWDDMPADAARRDFNTMLSRLRAQLPVDCFHGPRGQLGWKPDAGVTTDIADFYRWTASASHCSSPGSLPTIDSPAQKEILYRAVSLWRGPFLDGFSCDSASYEEWIISERHQWQLRILAALSALIDAERADGRWEHVAALAQRGLHIDALQEPFHRAVMEAMHRQGNRSGAMAQFELYRTTLMDELGAEPDQATVELFERIKAAGSTFPLVSAESAASVHDNDAVSMARPRLVPPHVLGITRTMPPLIGRQKEYARTLDALHLAVSQRRNHGVLLHGEAGIGKTRLLSELMDAAAGQRLQDVDFPTLLIGRAYESMVGVPYAMIIDAIDSVLPGIDVSAMHLSDVWLKELARLLPDVLADRPDLPLPEPMQSGDDRLRLFQAVAKFLSCLPQPILLTLDDLQWADSFSLSLLAYLLRYPSRQLHLTAVVTVRTGDDSDALRMLLNTLEREQLLSRVELTNLTKRHTFELLNTLFPEDGPKQAARVYSQSQGHPLHAVELMSMLRDTPTEGVDESGPLPVPTTVKDVFVGRLARLGDTAAAVADALAMFQRGATLDQLCAAADLDEREVVTSVQAMTRAYIVDENAAGVISFKHDVFQQVLLERMSPSRLTHLHRRAYAALVRELPADVSRVDSPSAESAVQQRLADLIAHSTGGRLWEEALRWTRQAAALAERLYAFPAAVEHLQRALSFLAELPDSPERRQERLDIELQIAKLDSWSPPAERDARLAAIARLAVEFGMTSHLPLVHMAQAESLILQGRCTEAAPLLDELEPLAEREPRLALGLNAWRGAVFAVVGDVKPALAHLGRVRAALGEQVLKPGTSVFAGMAACYATAGDFEQADAALAAMEEEEKRQGYQSLTGKFLTVAATVEYLRGRWNEAERYARRGLSTSRDAEDAPNEALAGLWLGAALLELKEPAEALQAVEAALAASRRAQSYTRRDFIYAFLALAYERTGRRKDADQALVDGFALARRFEFKEGHALCTEIRGRIALGRGDVEAAGRHLTDALTAFEALENAAGAARCQNWLASHPTPLQRLG